MKTVIFLFLLVLLGSHCQDHFKATEEWQEIKEGQTVPSGLHYRINLQTGKKEAKLLDEEEPQGDSTSPLLMTPTEGKIKTYSMHTGKY